MAEVTPPAAGAPQRPAAAPAWSWLAVPLMLGAMLCFTTLDSALKALAQDYPLGPIVFGRNLVQVVMLAAVARMIAPDALRTRRVGLHLARGAALVATTVFITLSLTHLPMTQTYAITFSTPLLATLMAAVALGEHPRPLQWLCLVAGFGGVLVALDPTTTLTFALLFPLGMATANALLYVLTRYGGRTESAISMVFWAGLGALVVSTLGLAAYVPMPPSAFLLLGAGSVIGTCGQLMMAAAFRRAPTAVVSPLLYSQIIWAMLLGWLLFDEIPTATAILGAVIVAASGIGVIRFAHRTA